MKIKQNMLKSFLFLFVALLSASAADAQDLRRTEREPQYLFGEDPKVSGWGAVSVAAGSGFDGDENLTKLGLGGGLCFGRALYFGGYVEGLATEINRDVFVRYYGRNQEVDLEFGHVGLWLGVSPLPHAVVHPTLNCKIGWGAATWALEELEDVEDWEDEFDHDEVFVLQPQLGAEVNVFRWMRFSVEAGYRFVNGLELAPLESNDLDGAFGAVTLRFGGF